MYEADEVLVAVAEAHAPAYAALEEGCRAREVEGDHALVLVPDVDHAVEAFVACLGGIAVEQVVPELAEFVEGLVDFLDGIEFGDGLSCPYLIYYSAVEITK